MHTNEPSTDVQYEMVLPPAEPPKPKLEVARQTTANGGALLLTEEDLKAAEKAVAVINKLKSVALKVTTAKDWTDISGVPHLNESGAMKVARLFGVSFTEPKAEVRRYEDEKGQPVEQYIMTITASFRGGSITTEGIASTKDDFFSHGGKLPFHEVDIASVRKKAMTNAYSRALKKLIGLGGLTWADLGEIVQKEQVASVQHKKGGRSSGPARQSEPMPQGRALDEKMWKYALDLAGGDMREAERIHAEAGSFVGKDGRQVTGPKRPENFKSDRWKASTYGKLKTAWEKECDLPPELQGLPTVDDLPPPGTEE